ncbi:hypothetical protein [Imhoffiella purpurea]|uniref:Uncharacterized protein n=1 Tax=Imhoffiella purpurea TaxID=1249627 RepID=W9VHP7_9GAMM|nr:hypothetical protein [Imhoffiella purpurea]EXJ15572.1 hypothetical protein D779_1314 [Imhoffiella purpurea]
MTGLASGLIRILILGLCLCLGVSNSASGGETLWREDAQRFRVGLKLFPACLGALESLAEYSTPDGRLLILVVYEGSDSAARQAASNLDAIGEIRGIPLDVRLQSAMTLDDYRGDAPGGIFVASVGIPPARLKGWSVRHRALVFSPFSGAVEDGAVAGLYVADRILPYVNRAQARRAKVRFRSFFLEVARSYEDE